MIISRTPYRISFFGGGSDYPAWYREHGGAVLSTTINKYSYITCRNLPPFFDYVYRLRYFQREEVQTLEEIKHPSIRECLRYMNYHHGVDLVHHGDLPALTGVGSSSTFTVGMLNALYGMVNRMPTKSDLAAAAIHVEQNILKESVGSQDQVAAAYGGFNKISFGGDDDFTVTPILMNPAKLKRLEASVMLFYTGIARQASKIAGDQIGNISAKKVDMSEGVSMVDEALKLLQKSDDDLVAFGELLDHQWKMKRGYATGVSNVVIDAIYERGISAGAMGGKLLGAGNGGFMMFLVEPELQEKVKAALAPLLYVPVRFDKTGSQIIYHAHDEETYDQTGTPQTGQVQYA